MNFYPGLTEARILRMPPERLEAFWLCITQIEAQNLLLALRVADYPHVKKRPRKETHDTFFKLAYPRGQKSSEKMTNEEFAKRLKARTKTDG